MMGLEGDACGECQVPAGIYAANQTDTRTRVESGSKSPIFVTPEDRICEE